MDEFKVPTVQLSAEVVCTDGCCLHGTVFMPALSAVQAGPMSPEEWINGPVSFFPFRPAGARAGLLLNKGQLLVFTVGSAPPESDQVENADMPVHRLIVESAGRRFEGTVVIDMPVNQRRVVDYFNRPGAFLLLRDGNRHHLIRKSEIARVIEVQEA